MSENIKLPSATDVDFETVSSQPLIHEIPEPEIDAPELEARINRMASKPHIPNTPERRAVIAKIQRFQIKFSKYIGATPIRGLDNLENLTHEELNNLLTELKMLISSRGNDEFFKHLYLGVLDMTSAVAPAFGVELPGLSNIANTPQIQDILTEISLDQEIEITSPYLRLGIATVFAVTQSFKMGLEQKMMTVKPEVQKQYEDL